jgi:hypothetical protein
MQSPNGLRGQQRTLPGRQDITLRYITVPILHDGPGGQQTVRRRTYNASVPELSFRSARHDINEDLRPTQFSANLPGE